MKPYLHLSAMCMAVLLLHTSASYSQTNACGVSNLKVTVNSFNASGSNCVLNTTISWLQSSNNGNKYSFVHLWNAANYSAWNYASSNPPINPYLLPSLGTIVINNPGPTATLGNTYPPDNTVVPLNPTSMSVTTSGSNYLFTITGVQLVLKNNNCSGSFTLVGDIWSSQSLNTVQCSSVDQSFSNTILGVSGSLTCNPHAFEVNITSSASTTTNFTYNVYADLAGTGSYSPSDPLIYSGSGSASLSSNYSSGFINYSVYQTYNLIIVASITGNPITSTGLITNTCPGTLPVSLVSFVGGRLSNASIALNWTTASEQLNRGFYVERSTDNQSFESVGFVSSHASNGNSSVQLDYHFTDVNAPSGNVFYRLVQENFDGVKTNSPVVLVKGSAGEATEVLIYPNPSANGRVTIAFSNTTPKEIDLIDITGKILQANKSITANNFSFSSLHAGLYILRVTDQQTGETSTHKFVVR